jgi:hypothetical protein
MGLGLIFSAMRKAMKLASETPRKANAVLLAKPRSGPWVI